MTVVQLSKRLVCTCTGDSTSQPVQSNTIITVNLSKLSILSHPPQSTISKLTSSPSIHNPLSNSSPRMTNKPLNSNKCLVPHIRILMRHELHHACLRAKVGEHSVTMIQHVSQLSNPKTADKVQVHAWVMMVERAE